MVKKDDKDKFATLAAARAYLLKQEGEGALISMSGDVEPVPVIPSGSFLIDLITGIGGFPQGRILEFFGPESSGKSTVLSSCAAQCQKMGKPVLYLDFENALDKRYLAAQGVDLSDDMFLYSQPDSMEQGFRIAAYCMEKGLIGLIVADSVAAMITEAEAAGEVGNTHAGGIAQPARVMSVSLKKLVPLCSSSGATLAFINQIRTQMPTTPFEKQKGITTETTPGGKSLKFYSSMRVKFKRVGAGVKGKVFDPVKGIWGDGIVANKVQAEVVKNKMAPPFRKAEFIIRYGIGIDDVMSLVMVAIDRNILEKNGSFITIPAIYHGTGMTTKLQGLEKTCDYFRNEFPPGFIKLEEDLRALIKENLDDAGSQAYQSEADDDDLVEGLFEEGAE